jgi:5-methyltetrahydropteroyltriglutamate--homocysteine methyltransferase
MKIRGEEVLLPLSTVGALPRPHWLQGRVLGTLGEPVYRSFNARVAYEDACKLAARMQEQAGLDLLSDGHQYFEWEAPGFQLEPIFHFIPENLGGFNPHGPPGQGPKYKYFYEAEVVGPITWERSIFEPVVMAMQAATDKPFKFSFLGPAQQSIIVRDRHYNDQQAVAMAIADALNKELHYLQDMGLEAVQLIDVLAPYTQDDWQIEAQNRLFDGIDMLKLWHVCYGSVDGQRDVFELKAADMMPLFHQSPVDLIHLEMTSFGFAELEVFKDFPQDKFLGAGVIDSKNLMVETPDVVADRVRMVADVVPAERICVMTDCGLGYFSRTVAAGKLNAMGEGTATVRRELS